MGALDVARADVLSRMAARVDVEGQIVSDQGAGARAEK
jgi:hypothetical protein